MKLGIGIDTGGTCTDAVIYRFEDKKVLAFAKTHTTKDDLSRGIERVLERLPRNLVEQSEVIALSTTLATNACVENKGGRAKLVFFGANKNNVRACGHEYGLPNDDTLIFVDSKTKPSGKVVEEPDWDAFAEKMAERFADCDAAGVIEMYAKKSGAHMEKEARERIQEQYDIPVVCGHELFEDNNIIKRGASTLLNARLISVIEDFIQAVKEALKRQNLSIPFVIVRSDGSLMTERFAREHPIETLLCGPVASVMGAVELTESQNCIVIDMGGTTTDIAFVKNGEPQKVTDGVHIGAWNTFVKGLFVDTFGLGGDSGVRMQEDQIVLEEEKVMPFCMAASRYPSLRETLERQDKKAARILGQKDDIYLGIRDISDSDNYTELEKRAAGVLWRQPMSLKEMEEKYQVSVIRSQLERLVREGVILRCGVTPTDVMHVRGDFTKYDGEASLLGLRIMARCMNQTVEEVGEKIYDAVKKKLYRNIVRILIEDACPSFRKEGIGPQLESLIDWSYEKAKTGDSEEFLGLQFSTPAILVGVGAPTHVFLEDVGKLLHTEVVSSEYAKVANALGAIVGNVHAKVTMEVVMNQNTGAYTVFGGGERHSMGDLEEAKALAMQLAREKVQYELLRRGGKESTEIDLQEKEEVVQTDFGPVYMGYQVTAEAIGELDLAQLTEQ